MLIHIGESKRDIRRFQTEDAEETAKVIAESLRISNSKDYPEQFIEFNIASHSANELIKASDFPHAKEP